MPLHRGAIAGTSAACVRYITRPQAVREREQGLLLYQMPAYVADAPDFYALRKNLVSYAWVQDARERALHQARGDRRVPFTACVVSFERSIDTAKAGAMVKEWLTANLSDTDGRLWPCTATPRSFTRTSGSRRGKRRSRKINLSARVFHSLDESWGRIYARAFGRDPDEQRLRKEEPGDTLAAGTGSVSAPTAEPAPLEDNDPSQEVIERQETNVTDQRTETMNRSGSLTPHRNMGITKQGLEEANAELEDRLLQSKAETIRLERENQALREALHQSETLLAQQSEQFEKLSRLRDALVRLGESERKDL